MSKELVIEILTECVDQQINANLGGIIGGKEEEKFAEQDLRRYVKARTWAIKNIK